MNIDGSGRPYTAKEWEDKLCKGENSLLAQKKRKIAEREAKKKQAQAPAPPAPAPPAPAPKKITQEELNALKRGIEVQRKSISRDEDDLVSLRFQPFSGDLKKSREADLAKERQKLASMIEEYEKKKGEFEGKPVSADPKIREMERRLKELDDVLEDEDIRMSGMKREYMEDERRRLRIELRKLKGSGELSSNDTIKGGSMDRLKKLLDAHPIAQQSDKKNTQGLSREAERTQLNTADARFNKQVYQNEVRQANLYEQSEMPPSPADVGVSFKIGSFVNKLSQQLGFKTDIYSQIQALLNIGQAPSRLIQDARLISLSTDYFKVVDIIATYNELVNYIQLYAPQIRASSDFANGVNTTYLLPLIQLLKQTAQLYLGSFNAFPTGRPAGADREAYERFRKGSAEGYATCMLMADNLSNAIYSSVSKRDIKRYETSNQILSQTFSKNPLPVAPPPPPPQPLPPAPIQPPEQGQQGQQGQQAPAQPQQAGRYASVEDLIRAYVADRNAQGIPSFDIGGQQGVLNSRRLGTANALVRDILAFGNDPTFSGNAVKQALPAMRAELIAQAQQGQQGRPPSPVGPQPPAQRQPSVPRRQQRQLTAEQQAYANDGGTDQATRTNPNYILRPIPELDGIENTDVWNTYTNLEDAEGRAIAPQEHRLLFDALPPAIISKLRRQQPDGSFDLDAQTASQDSLEPWIRNVKQIRQAWGNKQTPRVSSDTLYGLGNEEFLRGSGIMDTLSGWASKAGDALSGWYDTISKNMPTMSDVRRATSRIVPDKFQDYIPSGLQRTFTDKAKDFFGFGRSELEARKRLAELARGENRIVDMSQGRERREKMMPFINEFDPKAEFLKRRGEVLAGGVQYGVNENINDLLPYEMYGGNVDYDDTEEMTPFKRRIGMPNPFAPPRKIDTLPIRPVLASNATDIDETLLPFQQLFSTARSGHAKEQEKPKDMDENPDPIRITNENWKVFTGRQAKPKYKLS